MLVDSGEFNECSRSRQMQIWFGRRSATLIAVLSLCVGAAIAAKWMYAMRTPRAPIAAGTREFKDDPELLPTAAGGRNVSRPERINVPIAALVDAKPDSADVEPLAIADVGTPDLAVQGGDHVQPGDAAQSDNESVTLITEPLHAVASVPMQQEGSAEVIVPTANLVTAKPTAPNRTSDAGNEKTYTPLAVISSELTTTATSGTPHRATPDQFSGIFMPSANLVATPTASKLAKWSLDDETPLADPLTLFDDESMPNDSLRPFALRWHAEKDHQSASRGSPTSQDLIHAISESKLSWRSLYEMGRIAELMDGPAARIPFYHAAIMSEEWSFLDSSASPRDIRVMEVLAGTFAWAQPNDGVAIKALKLLMDWEQQANWSTLSQVVLVYADTLDHKNAAQEREVIVPLRNMLVTSALSGDDQSETHWALGRALFRSEQYAESATELSNVVQSSTVHPFTQHAYVLLTLALAKSGDLGAAQKVYEHWIAEFKQSKSGVNDQQLQRDIGAVASVLH